MVEGNTTIDTSGGAAGGLQGQAGGDGRFILGTNATIAKLEQKLLGSRLERFSGYISPNPLLRGIHTPNIPGLVGGPDALGLTGLSTTELFSDAVLTRVPANASALIARVETGIPGFLYDFEGYDMILFANPTNQPLDSPMRAMCRPGRR